MITNRLSPSSATGLDGCELQWFFGYGLYFREPNKDHNLKGTAAHSVMEAVGKSKQLRQRNKKWMKDEVFGRIYQEYNYDALIKKSFEYHRDENPHLEWGVEELADLTERCYKAKDGEHSHAFPENYHEIVETEQRFKLPINEDWAIFSVIEDGKVVKKQLHISGVIDLVYRDENGKLHFLDYKFGKSPPKDWNTQKVKTEDGMGKDIQLAMYYYAMDALYPGENPTAHIWYVLTDNYWTAQFDSSTIEYAKARIHKYFDRIRVMKHPKPKYSFKCRWCPYSQTKISDYTNNKNHDVKAIGNEKFDPIDGKKCACDALKYFFEYRSVDLILENLNGK